MKSIFSYVGTTHRNVILSFSSAAVMAVLASSCASPSGGSNGFMVSSTPARTAGPVQGEAVESIPILGNRSAMFQDMDADDFARRLHELPAEVGGE